MTGTAAALVESRYGKWVPPLPIALRCWLVTTDASRAAALGSSSLPPRVLDNTSAATRTRS